MVATVGTIAFLIIIALILITGGVVALRFGNQQNSPLLKGIGVVVLLIAAVTLLMTLLAVYWMLTSPAPIAT